MEISTKNQEEISICYFNAIVAKANAIPNINRRDENGIDATVYKTVMLEDEEFEVQINFQIKSTYSKDAFGYDKNKNIFYDLKTKNYNDLVKNAAIDRYLVLLILPEDKSKWVEENINFLQLKKCMYYLSLRGLSKSNNKNTVRVTFPKDNLFDSSHLIAIVNKSAKGE